MSLKTDEISPEKLGLIFLFLLDKDMRIKLLSRRMYDKGYIEPGIHNITDRVALDWLKAKIAVQPPTPEEEAQEYAREQIKYTDELTKTYTKAVVPQKHTRKKAIAVE